MRCFMNGKTLEESYNYYLDSSTKLKEATNGKIDLSKTGEYTTTALKLFNELNTVSPRTNINRRSRMD